MCWTLTRQIQGAPTRSWRMRVVSWITAQGAQQRTDKLLSRKNTKVQDQKTHIEIRDTRNEYNSFRTRKSYANKGSLEESCDTGTNNKAKEKGTSPNLIFYIYLPVWVAKLKRNSFNQKTKPHIIKHVSKKVKHKCMQLMVHRNHMLIVPQKHINNGYTYKSNITYTNKNKNTCKKHSK